MTSRALAASRVASLGWKLAFALLVTACGPRGFPAPPTTVAAPRAALRLVVQITIDQLRADLLTRYADRYGEGGLRRFLEQGTLYENARYGHAPTETAVGHATLFTGALPQDHGIVGNAWFDPALGRARAAVEDPASPWVPAQGAEGGASPRALRTTTLGDEMVLASGGRSLVYGVSLKDRGAIFAAGHTGEAFWYDARHGHFISSQHYVSSLPAWVHAFNDARPVDAYAGRAWELLWPASRYQSKPSAASGRSSAPAFPRPLPVDAGAGLYQAVKYTPFGDRLTLRFVEQLLAHEPLGRDDVPDLLAVSFSATDYIGHAFGPESLEMEDNLLWLDRTLAALFAQLLERVPAASLLVILSSDHGSSESPEALRALGLDAGRHDVKAIMAELNRRLEARYGPDSRFVSGFVNPTLWLDETLIAERGLKLPEVEQVVCELVRAMEGFAYAFAKSDLLQGRTAAGPVPDRVQRSVDRERTGHVYLVPSTGWLLADDAADLASMHGTPWTYDTQVPIGFWGRDVPAARVSRQVDPRDIAPTLAHLLGIKPPSASSGQVLAELRPRRASCK